MVWYGMGRGSWYEVGDSASFVERRWAAVGAGGAVGGGMRGELADVADRRLVLEMGWFWSGRARHVLAGSASSGCDAVGADLCMDPAIQRGAISMG